MRATMGRMLRSRSALGYTAALLAVLAVLATGSPALAQGSASLRITPPNSESFPTISVRASILDQSGLPVSELSRESFQVFEDGQSVAITAIEPGQAGIRQVFVINTVDVMGVRDTLGRTRFDYVRTALMEWFQLPFATDFGQDDLSLVTAQGVLINHASSTALLASRLDPLIPEYSAEADRLASLMAGINLISGETGASEGPAAVIFATPPLLDLQDAELQNALSLARQSGIAVYPVVVGLPENPEEPIDLSPFQRLADTTGGSLTILDSADPDLTTLADRVLSTRTQYLLQYRSQITEPGQHTVRVEVVSDELNLASSEREFAVQVAAPEIILVQPPTSITRSTEDPTLALDEVPPSSISLEYLITFPDGHPREVESVELIVDGQTISERSSPPFGRITWDISGFLQDSQPLIRVAVTDELGLRSESMVHRVSVQVDVPTVSLFALGPALVPLLVVLGIMAVGIIIAVVAIRTTRSSPAEQPPYSQRSGGLQRLQRASLDHAGDLNDPEAFLVPVQDSEPVGEPIPLIGVDLTLGSDASLAAHPIMEPSVSGLHARLIRQAGGAYLIRDQGSTAGTWVNHQALPTGGLRLHHGDLIHLGRVCLRFELAEPPPPPRIEVQPLEGGNMEEHPEIEAQS